MIRKDRDGGYAAIELAAGVGLILVPIVLMVLAFGPMLERRSFVRLASGEIARAYITSNGDHQAALTVISGLAETYRIGPNDIRVGMCGAEPRPLAEGGATDCGPLANGQIVSVEVVVLVPVFTLPWRNGAGDPVRVGGTEIGDTDYQMVDLYRSLP